MPVIIANMASDPPTLGMRIRRARQLARLSQEELAEKVGASKRAVGDWENDRRKPRSKLAVLEEVLGVSLDGTPDPGPEISGELLRAIMNEDGLTPQERQALIEAVRETLATERGASGASGRASG